MLEIEKALDDIVLQSAVRVAKNRSLKRVNVHVSNPLKLQKAVSILASTPPTTVRGAPY